MSIPYLAHAAAFSILIPVIVGLFTIRSLQPDLKLLLILFVVNAMAVSLQYYLGSRDVNNLWIGHFFNLIEYNMLTLMISDWQEKESTKAVFRLSMLVFTAFWIVAKLYLEKMDQPSVYVIPVSRVLLACASVYSLVGVAQSKTLTFLENPRFWVLSALLVSSAGGLMFYALRGMIAHLPTEQLLLAFYVHWSLIVVENLIYSGGFLCKIRR
ncbi:MAG: hypothetical protein WBD36_03650 [Bacteroidota bacterium]